MSDKPENLTLKGKIVVFVVGEAQPGLLKARKAKTAKESAGQFEPAEETPLPSAPTSVAALPVQKLVRTEDVKILDAEAKLAVKAYDPNFVVAEVSFQSSDILAPEIWETEREALNLCQKILAEYKSDKEYFEEYAVYCVSDYAADPEVFLAAAGDKIASLLKSEKVALDEKEVGDTLGFNIKYAKNDLTIVDWDGAFVFNPFGRFDQHIELFQLTNFQLLRLRKLDLTLDRYLDKTYKTLSRRPKRLMFRTREMREIIGEILKYRTETISTFEAIEKNIKLIGDWYSARLYELAAKKLHLKEWQENIKDKMETMEDIYSMVAENFSVSFETRMNMIQLVGWFILLLGWGVLLAFDIWLAVK